MAAVVVIAAAAAVATADCLFFAVPQVSETCFPGLEIHLHFEKVGRRKFPSEVDGSSAGKEEKEESRNENTIVERIGRKIVKERS